MIRKEGLSTYHPVDEDAIEYFSTQSQGDVRSALSNFGISCTKCSYW